MVVAKILLNSKNVDYLCFDNAKIMAQYCLDNKIVPYEVYENAKYIDAKDDDKKIYAKWMITMDITGMLTEPMLCGTTGRLIESMLYGFTHEYEEESYTCTPAYNKHDDNMRYVTVTIYLCVDANTTKDQVYNMAYEYLNTKVIKEIKKRALK